MAASENANLKPSTEQLYEAYKALLFSIAYRMLGTVADAEDIVQDTFAAVHSHQADTVRNMKAYLCKLTVNRCLNELKSARKQREHYVGEWLPEPLIASEGQPTEAAETAEALSYAFLVMMDRLSPLERAVYVLRTAFEVEYGDIARIVDKTETYCRKLFSNAGKRMAESGAQQVQGVQETRRKQLERFVSAFRQRNVERLLELLAEDAVLVTDGGGKVRAAIKPIVTRKRVMILLDLIASSRLHDAEAVLMPVSGRTEIVFFKMGSVVCVICLDGVGESGPISRIYTVFNPDKLKRYAKKSLYLSEGS